MELFVGAKAIVYFNGKILLLRESSEYADGSRSGEWDVPGGRIKHDEPIRDGLIREVKEESGLDVKPGEVIAVYDHFATIKQVECHIVGVYFLAEALTEKVVLSGDHDKFDWLDPKDVGDKQLMNNIAEVLEEFKKRVL